MHPMVKALFTGLALLALVGCGTSPASSPSIKRSLKPLSKPAATQPAAKSKQPARAPQVSTRPGSQAPAQPAKAAPQAPASEEGSLALAVKVTGNAPVASLAVAVFEQADPSLSQEFPLTLSAGAASWTAEEVPAGRYTFQVKALASDGSVLGSGNTEGLVKAGQATEVALEMRVNTVTPTDTTPSDGGPATIDLMIEIL
ncbi:MAG: hypothetical protein ACLGIN_02030 [Candidatus Sericytochromatia bacterium]